MSIHVPIRVAGRVERAAPPASAVAVAVILGLLAIGSLQGGVAMVADPSTPLGMTVDSLDHTPVDTYFWPGVFLLAIAGASIVTIPGLVFGWRWGWASRLESALGHRWPWVGAVAIGTVLLVFELIELYMVPFHPVMHPLLIGASVAILLLAGTRSAVRYFRPGA